MMSSEILTPPTTDNKRTEQVRQINALCNRLSNAIQPLHQLREALSVAMVTPIPLEATDRLIAKLFEAGAIDYLGLSIAEAGELIGLLSWNYADKEE